MKRFLFTACLMCALSLYAFAANPFSDVPASHWAYDAVSKLAAKGLISGFPDGSFKGHRVMTRYELAMVVAKLIDKAGVSASRGIRDNDLRVIEKLTVEFADELALIGVKVTALEDEIAVIKDDVALLKESIKSSPAGNGKIRFSGSVQMRAESNSYDKGANSPIASAAANTFTGVSNARTAIQTNENATNFRTKVKIFIDADIDDGIAMHTELRNRIANVQYDAWGSAAHSADDQFSTDVYEAYVKVDDFYGWADTIKFGRQYYGVANGVMFSHKLDAAVCDDCDVSPYGYDGITVYKRFNDVTSIDVYGLRTDNDADTGLNILGLTANFELESNLKLKVFYASRSDNQIFDPADGADYTDVSGFGAWLAAAYAGNANYAANHDNPTKVQYYGLAVNGDIIRDLTYYAELAVKDYLDTVLDPDDYVNWVDSIGPQKAFLLGLNWQAKKDLRFVVEFRSADEYYSPITAGRSLYAGGWNDADCMGDTEFDNLGYTGDFRDLFLKADYAISEKTNVIVSYEAINDTTSIPGLNRADDDMQIWSIGFRYKYKPNTVFKLYYKQFNIDDVNNGAVGSDLPVYFNDANNNGVYDRGVDALNLHDPAQEDHSQVRCEMHVKF